MCSDSLAGERAALLVGNASYPKAQLITPLHDVHAMSQALREARFTVTIVENATQRELYERTSEFFKEHANAGIHLFYYAGHSIQFNGRNYLIPVDADFDAPDVFGRLFDLRHLLDKLEAASATTRIVILDACRNNPFSQHPNASSGLSELIAPANTFVAFSTAPGAVASDGASRNSPYTRSLLSNLFRPGERIEDVFKAVRREVRKETNGSQTPWESTSLEHDFALVPHEGFGKAVHSSSTSSTMGTRMLGGQRPATADTDKRPTARTRPSQCGRLLSKLSLGFPPLSATEKAELSHCN